MKRLYLVWLSLMWLQQANFRRWKMMRRSKGQVVEPFRPLLFRQDTFLFPTERIIEIRLDPFVGDVLSERGRPAVGDHGCEGRKRFALYICIVHSVSYMLLDCNPVVQQKTSWLGRIKTLVFSGTGRLWSTRLRGHCHPHEWLDLASYV